MCAKLCRSLCGARAALARWEALCTSVLESFGFARGRLAHAASTTPSSTSGVSCTGATSPSPGTTWTWT
eukprot:13340815-Alexandrium_andersonii.AAC.1